MSRKKLPCHTSLHNHQSLPGIINHRVQSPIAERMQATTAGHVRTDAFILR